MAIHRLTEEEEAIEELKAMGKNQLFSIDHDRHTLECSVEGCCKYWNVKDFGISPWFVIRGKWYDLLNNNYVCEKHFKAGTQGPYKKGSCIDRLNPKKLCL